MDIDECVLSAPCAGNKFCLNVEGSYRCVACDRSCHGCNGDGPNDCLECAAGFTRRGDGTCASDRTSQDVFGMTSIRYLTYAGLCVAAAIIAQSSIMVAGLLGLVIAFYITVSEYYLLSDSDNLQRFSDLG